MEDMRRPRPGGVAFAGLVALSIAACTPMQTNLTEDFREDLADWSAGKALDEGVARQSDPTAGDAEPGKTYLAPGDPIWVQIGKSRIVHLERPVRRVSIANPEIAGIVVLSPTTLLINAKAPAGARGPTTGGRGVAASTSTSITGRTLTAPPEFDETTMIIWDRAGNAEPHTIFVAEFLDRQVLLEVTVAELNRTAFEEHGIDFQSVGSAFSSNFFMGGGNKGGFAFPSDEPPLPPAGDALLPIIAGENRPNFAFRLPGDDVTAFIQILQGEGLATVLAQPKIMALSGQESVFQVGGEIPIQIVTAFTSDILFKPFGTLVNFLPRVTEEGTIILTVTPEVSRADFNSPVNGIPTFRTRRVSTSAKLRDGETLVLGGLIETTRVEDVEGVPYLQDIPIVGHIFRQTSYDDQVTELMVLVTPRLVKPIPAGSEPLLLPTDRGPLTNEEIRTKPDPAEATRPRIPGLGTGLTVPGLP